MAEAPLVSFRGITRVYGEGGGQVRALAGVDLAIGRGEFIAIMGPSGSGKSTLANLVCRFYDPSSGSIKVDGVDLRDMAIADYHANLGCVLQEPFLFFGSVACLFFGSDGLAGGAAKTVTEARTSRTWRKSSRGELIGVRAGMRGKVPGTRRDTIRARARASQRNLSPSLPHL